MKRIQTPTAVPDMFGLGKPGFTDGNPNTGVLTTDLDARFFNQIQESVLLTQEEAGLEAEDDPGQLAQAIKIIIKNELAALGGPFVPRLSAIPATRIVGLDEEYIDEIYVKGLGEMVWTETAFFNGYRTPLCGTPMDGATIAPLMRQIDAVGGLLSKTAYAGLWAIAQENGLVVSQAVWDANRGSHWFVDVSPTHFRVPDLRNMFRRYTGTDADTANARTLGSKQGFQIQSHTHATNPAGTNSYILGNNGAGTALASGSGTPVSYNTVLANTGGAETRSVNTAYHPRIHA